MGDWGRRLVFDAPLNTVVNTAFEEFEREGFEVAANVDVREGVWQALREECRCYRIITLWHPSIVMQALRHSLDIGVELRINIAIYELADDEIALVAGEPLPSLADDRTWRDECPELLPIELRLSNRLAQALGRLSRRLRAPASATTPGGL